MRRALRAAGALLFWAGLALTWLAGCSHRYASQQSAHRTEQEKRTFQTAKTAESQTQSVATEQKKASKRTREFDPKTGNLVRDVLEQYESDGRVQVDSSASASASATGQASKSVAASSSSSTKADTRADWSPWWWALLVIPLAAGAWALRRGWRSFIPGW